MGAFRVFLALSVLMAHSEDPGTLQGFGGENAVEVFFVISGFYISAILTSGYKQIRLFYLNRFLRLYPIYYLILFLSIGLFLVTAFYNSDFSRFSHPWEPLLLAILANGFILGTDSIMFLQWHEGGLHLGNFTNSEFPIHSMLFIPQAWTLSLEIMFYILAPLLIRLRNSWLIALALSSLLAKVTFLSLVSNTDPWTYRFFPFEIHLFLLGIAMQRYSSKHIKTVKLSKNRIYLLTAMLFMVNGYVSNTWIVSRYIWLAVLVCLLFLIILFGESDSTDRKLGELSYPIYISHIFVIQVCYLVTSQIDLFDGVMQSSQIRILLSVLGTFLVSQILIKCTRKVEQGRDLFRLRAKESSDPHRTSS